MLENETTQSWPWWESVQTTILALITIIGFLVTRSSQRELIRAAGRSRALELAGEQRFRAILAVRARHEEIMKSLITALESDAYHDAALYLMGLETVIIRAEWPFLTRGFKRQIDAALGHAWEYQRARLEADAQPTGASTHVSARMQAVQSHEKAFNSMLDAFRALDTWMERVSREGWGDEHE